MRYLILPTLLFAATTSANATAVQGEDLDLLDARVAVFLGGTAADAGLRAARIDRRLRLVRCPEGALFEPPHAGSVVAYCPAKGWRLNIPLVAATSVEAGAIVVRRGDAVQLSYAGAGFALTTGATALEDGRRGGTIRVKMPTSPASVTARVQDNGNVEITD